jgi:hypothetical protein
MKNSILFSELSENKIDKMIINTKSMAGWIFTTCKEESWFFTFTNGDNSSNTGGNCGACARA